VNLVDHPRSEFVGLLICKQHGSMHNVQVCIIGGLTRCQSMQPLTMWIHSQANESFYALVARCSSSNKTNACLMHSQDADLTSRWIWKMRTSKQEIDAFSTVSHAAVHPSKRNHVIRICCLYGFTHRSRFEFCGSIFWILFIGEHFACEMCLMPGSRQCFAKFLWVFVVLSTCSALFRLQH
jgi:hypothetical protein